MKKIKSFIQQFFFPPDGTPLWQRVLPYAILGVLTLVVLIAGAYGWEYTNSPEFCGEACHTMPPEYTAYQTSPHARVDCVDCHIGDGFITTRITRKAGDAKHIISLLFRDYEYPITAHQMRPARETCELCHFPEKFSADSLREIDSFESDRYNTPLTTYLVMKTGGGAKRLGLGQGIHWHIENQVLYYPLDSAEQEIPYIQVIADDGSVTEYWDVESDFDADQIVPEGLKEMDCITCHNRISHLVNPPEKILDRLIDHGLIERGIPEIKRVAVEIFYRDYDNMLEALANIAVLDSFYRTYYPEFYAQNQTAVTAAIAALKDAYSNSVYPEQKSDWNSHPNNIGHQFSPGCLRCHDGKHLNAAEEAIRLECNLCHSIPVVAGPGDFLAQIEISRGPEPGSHLNPNWISLHHQVFDQTCQNCHTVEDPGGVSNTSFCSNSACHGSVFDYAGFDAPALRVILQAQLPAPTPTPTPTSLPDESAPEDGAVPDAAADLEPEMAQPLEPPQPIFEGDPTFENIIGTIFQNRCAGCHGSDGLAGLDLSQYAGVLAGSQNHVVIQPGDSANSLLVQIVSQGHFSQFTPDEFNLVVRWIDEGAPEK